MCAFAKVDALSFWKKLQMNKFAGLNGMKTVHFGCGRAVTHATIDNIQLLYGGELSKSPFYWGGPHTL
jgi:hypothetical protein